MSLALLATWLASAPSLATPEAPAAWESGVAWSMPDASACPAWLSARTPVLVDLSPGRAAIAIGPAARPLAGDGAGKWKLVARDGERPAAAGEIRVEEGARWALRFALDRCTAEGRPEHDPRAASPEGVARLHALEAAGAKLAASESRSREGRLAEASRLAAEGCSELRAAGGEEAAALLSCGTRLSIQARNGGRYAEALEEARSAAAALAARVGERHVDTLAARAAEAQALWFLSRPQEALDLSGRTWEARKLLLGAEHPDTLASRNTMAASLRLLGRNADAIAVLREILPVLERVRGPAEVETLRVRNNLGVALLRDGRAEEAVPLLEEVLRTRMASLGERHPETLTAWSNCAYATFLAGDPVRAMRLAEEAIPAFLATFGPDHPETLRLQVRLASFYLGLGRDDDARDLAEALLPRIRKAFGERHIESLQALANLGVTELYAGRTGRAVEHLRRARAGFEAQFGPRHPATLQARESLGFALLRTGKFEEAREVFESGLGAGKLPPREAGPVALAALVRHAGAATARFESGDRAEALRMLDEVWKRKREQFGADHPETLATLATLAELRVRAGDREGAIALLEELVSLTEHAMARSPAPSEAQIATLASRVGEDVHQAGYATLAWLLADRDPARALGIAELSKSRSLAETLGADLRAQSLEPAARARLRTLGADLAKAESALLQADPASAERLERLSERSRLQAEAAGLIAKAEGDRRDPVATLPPDAVFVSYLATRNRMLAFATSRRGAIRAFDLGESRGIEATVDAWRRLSSSADPESERVWRLPDGTYRFGLVRPDPGAERTADPAEISRVLSRRLLAPLAPAIGEARRWIVSPDGPLAFMPFELLEWRGRPVLEQATISYVPSLETLALLQRRAAQPGRSSARGDFLGIGIANPGTVSASGRPWGELPSAVAEVRAIAQRFGPARATTLIDREATEGALAALDRSGRLAQFRYVHLATHAYLSDRNAKLSAVVLSPEGPLGDGLVTAAEWTAHRLGAELVVLSACETGLGQVRNAEGVVGLPYAMMASGANAALVSLWRVADEGAKAFMDTFYRRALSGMPPSRALRETKLEFLRSGGPWSGARHWAPFVLYGAP